MGGHEAFFGGRGVTWRLVGMPTLSDGRQMVVRWMQIGIRWELDGCRVGFSLLSLEGCASQPTHAMPSTIKSLAHNWHFSHQSMMTSWVGGLCRMGITDAPDRCEMCVR